MIMLIKINGRLQHFSRVEKVTMVRPGHYEAKWGDMTFKIEGGKAAGGTSREWFLSGPTFTGSLEATSLVDALNLIDTV